MIEYLQQGNYVYIGDISMGVSYKKLFKLLIDKDITKTELATQASISRSTLAKISKHELVSMDVILRICDVLKCDIGDVIEISEE